MSFLKDLFKSSPKPAVVIKKNKRLSERVFLYDEKVNPETLKLMRSLNAITIHNNVDLPYALGRDEVLPQTIRFPIGMCFYHYVLTNEISTLSAEKGSVIEKVLLSSRDKPDTPVTPISDAELETITSEQIKTLSPDILTEVNKYEKLKSSYGGGGKRKRVAAKPKATTAKPKPRPRVKATTKAKAKAKTAATKPRAKPKAKPKPKAVKK